MILPDKHLSQERALMTIGANVLELLDRPKTVGKIWSEIPRKKEQNPFHCQGLTYDLLVLALDLLFMMDLIVMRDGRLRRTCDDS